MSQPNQMPQSNQMSQPNQELFNLIFHDEQDYTLIPDQLADHLADRLSGFLATTDASDKTPSKEVDIVQVEPTEPSTIEP
ncbi:hypothetical protein [Corynebacterium cystitidis]|uniref:hypothetical protein n=1 Tax=Corynebacterium cystitidis TaxID=35757 RepID=UPI00211E0B74|nr:hypothetical protein [Corynebacterium cystitidis]